MMGNQVFKKNNGVEEEFEGMKRRHENFVKLLVPSIRDLKVNVFYHLVNEQRTMESFVEMARGTRPFLAKEIWDLMSQFMDFMRNVGGVEGTNYKIVYDSFTPADLVKRLLFKRPLVFVGATDFIVLRSDGTKVIEGIESSCEVAKNLNRPVNGSTPYLKEYISYDENLLSSLICMSTPTYYVSDGSIKKLGGEKFTKKSHIDQGILCGLVGARNRKASFMENHYIHPRNDKYWTNYHLSDDFWMKYVYADAFPEGKIPTLQEIDKKPQIYKNIYKNGVNVVYFEKRLMLSILPFIREAAARGCENRRNVFCSVPPIGGGVWAGKVGPAKIHNLIVNGVMKFLDNDFDYSELKYLKALVLPTIGIETYKNFKLNGKIEQISLNESESCVTLTFKEPTNHTIKIYDEIRYVAKPLPEEFNDCISIAGYAWDGNSYPGNEYWIGELTSFDPQAVYCSLLGQFQNPEVNVKMADAERIRIY